MTTMTVKRFALSALSADAANVRRHSDKNLRAIAGSLTQFGQVEPLVVQSSSKRVIGGNGRLEAMHELGWTHANCVLVDVDDVKAAALAIALNRTGELATWDYEGLGKLLESLHETVDLDALGWDAGEIRNLLAAEWATPEVEPLPETEGEGDITIRLSGAQCEAFKRALARARERAADASLSYGACIELLCGEYLVRHGGGS